MDNQKLNFILQQADNGLILGQRLGEWCGHGPVLEQDIAMTNISLDLIGQARLLYQYAAEMMEENTTEDDLAYLRDAWDFRNVLLTEQPNGDFAQTIIRQFLYDTYSLYFYEMMLESNDERLASIAAKSHKEVRYHIKWSVDWVLRLGDGTDESHQRAQQALDLLWPYSRELVMASEADQAAQAAGYGPDLKNLEQLRTSKLKAVLEESTLVIPEGEYYHSGGKEGRHSEHLGYILADLQFLQRAYPGNKW